MSVWTLPHAAVKGGLSTNRGCSSLRRLRFVVLLNIGTGKSKEDAFCLIDIKEANPAAAPRARDADTPKDNGKRVVEGARHLSPALGDRMMAAKLLGRSVVLRELMPQDLKLEFDQLSREEAVDSARVSLSSPPPTRPPIWNTVGSSRSPDEQTWGSDTFGPRQGRFE